MTPKQKQNFKRMISPRHVAFIGGTDAAVAINEARRRGFQGECWPVNPKHKKLAGLPCYASVGRLPEPPDAVFMAIPAALTVKTADELSKMGAGGIVCYSAGFKEAGQKGEILEQKLAKAVGDMALIGPNCYGIINYLDNLALWPFAHGGYCIGYGAAIITQSGMLSSDILMSQRSLPLTMMISAGNQAIMGLEDFLDVLCENSATRAIGMHIEGLSNIAKFEEAALKAIKNNVSVVALKTGKSNIGRELTLSHTGSLSGSMEMYEALFERCGVISVSSPSQFLETLKYLCLVKRPNGNSIAGFTCSGGGATMLADYAEEINLEFPQFDEANAKKLRKTLPPIATVSNPLDYTTPIWGKPNITKKVFEIAIAANDVDATVLVQDYPAEGLDESKVFYSNDASAFGQAARKLGVPAAICSTLPENLDKATREELIAKGLAPMQGIQECLNAIRQAATLEQRRKQILNSHCLKLPPRIKVKDKFSYVNEAQGKHLLDQLGISVPKGKMVKKAQIASAAKAIGFPVALKMMSPKLIHKTEAGAVKLSINNIAELQKASREIRLSVLKHDPGAITDEYLVESMARPPIAELLVNLRRDDQFGWVLTLGSGGAMVELLEDSKTILLPADTVSIKTALCSLKSYKLLTGFRGGLHADVTNIVTKIDLLTKAVQDPNNKVQEVEINPLFVYQRKVLAVDVFLMRYN